MNKSTKIVKGIIFCIVGAAIVLSIIWSTMYLWNWLVPDLFNGPVINIWQTVGLLLLSRILFGRWSRGCKPGFAPRPWRHYTKERWANMSAEDQEKFKQKLKDKWCYKEQNTQAANSGTSNG
ncbi:MAG TPA: hypothetical protein PLM56_01870 [Cyclobacteriaceae bacterium]|jgi:hypothetical protein|nr:hypothetical protein [Cytophagales bacterium]HRE66091.1 hypothetical protein [Cyclobacteriaceae bacterium]HRF32218.1 hypothetical protein [Cyclobacteriaceae bacterium]